MLDALFPVSCAGCGSRGVALCDACLGSFRRAPARAPFVACFAYEGAVREVIARAKYRNERAALRVLAHALVACVPADVDVVTWAPASRARRARTGVDHGAVIARVVGCELGVVSRALLRRGRDIPQTGRDKSSRRAGPRVVATTSVPGLRVLVVDDVTTTGSTLAGCIAVLRAAGAHVVHGAALARTPGPRERLPDRSYNASPPYSGR